MLSNISLQQTVLPANPVKHKKEHSHSSSATKKAGEGDRFVASPKFGVTHRQEDYPTLYPLKDFQTLRKAIEENDIKPLKAYIAAGKDINILNTSYQEVLPNGRLCYQQRPLELIIELDRKEFLESFFNNGGSIAQNKLNYVVPDAVSFLKRTCDTFSHVVYSQKWETFFFLLEKAKEQLRDVEYQQLLDQQLLSVVGCNTTTDLLPIVHQLIHRGANINGESAWKKGVHLLECAAGSTEDEPERFEQILNLPGLDLKQQGPAALNEAIRRGRIQLVQTLLEKGVTPLPNAVNIAINSLGKKHYRTATLLSHYGTSLNTPDPITGHPPLLQAILRQDIETVDFLLSLGVPLTVTHPHILDGKATPRVEEIEFLENKIKDIQEGKEPLYTYAPLPEKKDDPGANFDKLMNQLAQNDTQGYMKTLGFRTTTPEETQKTIEQYQQILNQLKFYAFTDGSEDAVN